MIFITYYAAALPTALNELGKRGFNLRHRLKITLRLINWSPQVDYGKTRAALIGAGFNSVVGAMIGALRVDSGD